jgi:DNA-directed RNA polymerase subunit alpha
MMEVQTNIQTLESTETYGKFVVTPLERGYGQTLGNALRRVLLSSIPGMAIKAVRVERVLHEFAPIPGVKEDMNELLLNLRELAIRLNADQPPAEDMELVIDVQGPGRVTGEDVQTPRSLEIVNPDCYLCTISDPVRFYAELYVGWGSGYALPETHTQYKGTIGLIPTGSQYTPVRKVNYLVEATRVGQRTDFERLTLEVVTNGAVSPAVAVGQAAQILTKYLRMFFDLAVGGVKLSLELDEEVPIELENVPDIRIEEMDFTQRTLNSLKRADVFTLRDLLRRTKADLKEIRGLGQKSLNEVEAKLKEMGYELRQGKLKDLPERLEVGDFEEGDESDLEEME